MTKKSLLTLIESEVWQFSALCMAFTVPSTKKNIGMPTGIEVISGGKFRYFPGV